MATDPSSNMQAELPRDFNIKLYKYFTCVILEGKTVMTKVVQQIYASLPSSKNGTVPLRDYLRGELKWKETEMKGVFTKLYIHLLNTEVMSTSFKMDISLACRLLPKVFEDVYGKLSKECKKSIEDVKHMRNKFSHAMEPEESIDMKSEICKLQNMYENIYNGVGTAIDYNFSEDSDATKNTLTMVLDSTLIEDVELYQKNLEEFKKEVSHRLLIEGRKELQDYYSKLRVVNPCTWMLQGDRDIEKDNVSKYYIEKIYTPLKIKSKCRGAECEIDTKNLLTTTMLKRKNKYIIPNGLLLNGLAGCGKTSLCRYILHDWRTKGKEIDALEDMNFVFLVEARSVRSKNLKDFLTEQMLPSTLEKLKNEKIDLIPMLLDMRVLFLIDGFDEASKDTKNVIKDIFARFNKKSEHRILITTRPEFLEEVGILLEVHNFEYIIVKVYGFDENGIKSFTEKVFKEALHNNPEKYVNDEKRKFLEYLNGRGRILNNQLYLPLTLALLIHLWIHDKDKEKKQKRIESVTNCTTLYFQLFSLCKDKVIERLIFKEKHVDMKTINGVLLFIGQTAWNMMTKDHVPVIITPEEKKKIEDECKRKHVEEIEIMSAFLECECDDNQDSKEILNYSFLHKVQMEYLAAEFLADRVKNGRLEEVKALKSWHGYYQVIVFLVGHLALSRELDRQSDLIFDLVDKADIRGIDFDFWWKFLVEAERNTKVAKIIANKRLPETHWELVYDETNENLVSGLELLGTIPVKIESIKIEVNNSMDPYNIKDMYKLMKDLKYHLKHRNKHNPLFTELHFWRHYNIDGRCNKHSNDFVKTLQPWGHLTNLTGSLGDQEEGSELLNYCFKLKTIIVRLCTLKTVKNLHTSLKKIHRTVRKLRITLDMSPGSVDPANFPSLTFRGDLLIHIPGIKDENKEWVVATVKSLSRGSGCDHLELDNSELSYDSVVYLLKNLTHVVIDKLTVGTLFDITLKMKLAVEEMENDTHIRVNWLG
ncbi:hypothetical protein Pmani_037715 [Petrolisthes manimaculis]|uniref:NACHT domain-containing protein n=1 Tax=Petrolisthes manimaculis TaxID=1843537 RepID=A0AAE1TKV8_9EUCA|nr:hypothetical protein Pmani_037715 [Petrolisthes manimaculis]